MKQNPFTASIYNGRFIRTEDSDDDRLHISQSDPEIKDYQEFAYRKGTCVCEFCGSRHGSLNMLVDHVLIVHYNMIDNYRYYVLVFFCLFSQFDV